jgi:hypothetical protein
MVLGEQSNRLQQEGECCGPLHGESRFFIAANEPNRRLHSKGIAIIGAMFDCISPHDFRSPLFCDPRELAA